MTKTKILSLLAILWLSIPAAQSQTSPTSCLVPPSGLVGWWPGDSNANDIVGTNNATTETAVTYVPGEVQDGFDFTASGFIGIPESPTLENQQFTWVAWVRPDGPGPDNDRNGSVIVNQLTTSANFVQLSWSAGSEKFVYVFGNNSTEFLVSTDTFPIGSFYLVAGTYDGSTFRLYVDGVLEGSFADIKTVPYSSLGWQFGGNSPTLEPYPAVRNWNGVIDEVQAFNRALNQTEIQSIYTNGSGGECKGTPSINAGGIINAASFAINSGVSPGSIAAVFGNFSVNTLMQASTEPLPTSLSGIDVTYSIGATSPLFFVSPYQVNMQVPWELAGQTQGQVSFTVSGEQSAPQPVAITQYAPGIFTLNGQGTGQGAILNYPSYQVSDSSTPAVAGTTVLIIYCTGLGPVSNQPASGAAPAGLSETSTIPTVTVGGVPAPVLFSGLAPSFVGVYQINAQLPAGVPSGSAVPVVISIGGATSNTATIAVQ